MRRGTSLLGEVMALLLEEGVGMSLHAAREESDMFLMADMLSCSPTTCAGVFLISGFLILSLLVVGEEPEVSLMIVPDDDEACASEAGDTEASEASLATSTPPHLAVEDAAKDSPEATATGGGLTEGSVGGADISESHSGSRSGDRVTSVSC